MVHHFKALESITTYVNVGGDVLLVVSLFGLGGEFWERIRALFSYSTTVQKTAIES